MKKKCVIPVKLGVARQHLMENYSPVCSGSLQMGHVFVLLIEQEKSVARTIRAVCEIFPCTIRPNDMYAVLQTLNAFKHPHREKEMKDFIQCCSEPFTRFTAINETQCVDYLATADNIPIVLDNEQPSTSVDQTFSSPTIQTASPSITVNSVRSSKHLTPRKIKLKRHLSFISKLKCEQTKRYIGRVKHLKGLINRQRMNKIKYLNQEINRKTARLCVKEATITMLRRQLKETKERKEVQGADAILDDPNLRQLRRTHKRLKDSNKIKRKLKQADTVPIEKFSQFQLELKTKNQLINVLENKILALEEEIEEFKKCKSEPRTTKKDGKTYSTEMRMIIYDAIAGQVPTQNISSLIGKHAQRIGETLSTLPHRTTVEQMARELDAIADVKAAEMAMKITHLTIGFDATTQEGVHINSVHLTTKAECEVTAIDELPGGTAEDYSQHVCGAIDHLAATYASFHKEDYSFCRSTIIDNISNTMTDRVIVNHAAIRKVNENWGGNAK